MIRIGPAGWSCKDWEGVVYPSLKPNGFHPETYLAQYFDLIEINSTFYRAREPGNWARRVGANPDFRFPAELFRCFMRKLYRAGVSKSEIARRLQIGRTSM